jgi:predicted DCC family thiol-disulfide oxidoreductase YuxK
MSEKPRQESDDAGAVIIYDGECPFCSSYVSLVRIREAVGDVKLVDARSGGPHVDAVVAAGYDLDEGMVLKFHGRYYHGADCMHMIALLSTPSTWFNRFNGILARSPRRIALLYPVLRAGRNATLRLLGRRKLGNMAAR